MPFCFSFKLKNFCRLVDIICVKMSEGADNEANAAATNTSPRAANNGINVGAGGTRLTDSSNASGLSQSCQC